MAAAIIARVGYGAAIGAAAAGAYYGGYGNSGCYWNQYGQ